MHPLNSKRASKKGDKNLIRPNLFLPPQLPSSNPVATFAGSMDAKKRWFSDVSHRSTGATVAARSDCAHLTQVTPTLRRWAGRPIDSGS